MKKKLIIYLLAAVMVLSPAAVFADTADTTGTGTGDLEVVQSDAMNADETWTKGWNASKTQYKDDGGVIQKGLFKGRMKNGSDEYALFHADANGFIEKRVGPVTVSGLQKGAYYSFNGRAFDYDSSLTSPVTYFQKYDSSFDCYCMDEKGGLKSYGGGVCYLQPNGTVQTTPGIINVSGKYYYVNAGGTVRTTAGFFKANNGKTYLSDATGAIITTAGIRQYGGSYYVIQSDGSVGTTVGFVRAGGKLCYVTNTNGVLAVNKEFKVNGKKYHALNDATIAVGGHKWGKKYYFADDSGAIRTKKGIMKAGGQYYYVQKGGAVATNKKVKWKGKSYIAGKNGAIYRGLFTWKKNLYYANKKGVLRTKAGVITYDAHKYYVQKGGKIKRNVLFTAYGRKYCADRYGRLLSGYFYWRGSYYLTNAKCVIITKQGLYSYNGKTFFVKPGGALGCNEFVTNYQKHYYVNGKGVVLKSKFTYRRNGVKYTIHPNSRTGEISSEEYYKVFPEEAPKPEPTATT